MESSRLEKKKLSGKIKQSKTLNDNILSAGPCRAVKQPCSKHMNDPSKNTVLPPNN
jgi:hypothetical protein